MKWLLPSLSFSALLLGVRIWHTESPAFSFLVWNLFLAFVPVLFARQALHTAHRLKGWLYAALWLLFFPNAMYIVTDLFHLWKHPGIPLWYDLLLLFSCALNGIAMGFYSLHKMEQWLQRNIKTTYIKPLILGVMIASGFGIYLGRFQRWNSWDIVTQPFSLLADIGRHVVHPFRHAESWEISLLFGVWMYLLYQYFIKTAVKLDRT
jgi:uncharacterized membrane protein